MNYIELLDKIFSFRLETILPISAVFLVPGLRIITLPIRLKSLFLIRTNKYCGYWEWITSRLRDVLGIPFLSLSVLWNGYRWLLTIKGDAASSFLYVMIASILLLVINEVSRRLLRREKLKLLDFIVKFPAVHPQEFFDYFYSTFGSLHIHLPEKPFKSLDPFNIDFRKSQPKARYRVLPSIIIVIDLMIITRLILFANKWRNRDFLRKLTSSLALILSSRQAQLSRTKITIEGLDRLAGIKMPMIYLFNHTSAVDFLTVPIFLLAHQTVTEKKIPFVPCFMMARDHFLDNPLIYHIIGLGKAAELLDMIFIERRHRTTASAQRAVKEAIDRIINKNLPLAIYPQGSRARNKVSANGSRLDAGYYTVGNLERLKHEGGHIKKGAAYIATDVALHIIESNIDGPVNLIPVTFTGAASILPRDSIKIWPNNEITVRVGDPIVVTKDMVAHLNSHEHHDEYHNFIESINKRIDQALKTTFRLHADLECRFFEDMRNILDPYKMEELSIALKQWRGEDYLFYLTLDYIYTCKPKHWPTLLGQLAHLILNDALRNEIIDFKNKVAEIMVSK